MFFDNNSNVLGIKVHAKNILQNLWRNKKIFFNVFVDLCKL